ncbi:hypothetical protein [Iningainema tapete]|uniref:Uncharacterized protein n=1 Tax=Iningainema tapete BLCC-T55 TaxID=2748662 RepID=A0A8J6XVP8_9CYAN|nr:hypothetical protein [Iningainema tapete]MBD2774493.1 hypothetical protein [Iningainema tapete BLCC-T55]
MATITIFVLRPAGSELFSHSESYLGNLSEEELSVYGGITPSTTLAASSISCAHSIAVSVAAVTASLVYSAAQIISKSA